ncbi:MAG: diguanylate cyclase [Anaerolineales bacterium]|nr:diguanylate cyclase [Anaerolineales bacterium]
MTPPDLLYSVILFTTGAVCFTVGVIVWQRRPFASGSIPLIAYLATLCWWDFTYGLFWANAPTPVPTFWLDVSFVAPTVIPGIFLIFALQVSEQERWIKKPLLYGLCVEPLTVLILMWSDPWHGLFFGGKRPLGATMIQGGGPVFWAHVVYSYLMILLAFVILVRRFQKTSGIYRRRLGVIIIGAVIPWVNSFLFVFGYSPIPYADNTPFSTSLAAFAFAYAVLHYRLFDIVPVARDALVEEMTDGVIALDASNRVVDINPAAARGIGAAPDDILGKPVADVFSRWEEIVEEFMDVRRARVEILEGNGSENYLDLQISPLYDRKKNYLGRLIVWRDISHLKQTQMELEKIAMQDPLTSIYNRRHFFTLAEAEIERALRYHTPCSIILADIDQFKNVNDQYGHKAGDEALICFTKVCRKSLRKVDIFARYGGEEFIALLPETELEQAVETAERIRQIVASSSLESAQFDFGITASFGVAAFQGADDTLDHLIQRADQSLYEAKNAGRNRVVGKENL